MDFDAMEAFFRWVPVVILVLFGALTGLIGFIAFNGGFTCG